MIGYLRLSLSLLVVRAHLGPTVPGYAAATAVVVFYVLAGYTATANIQCRYSGQSWRFLWSRFLRLWPTYAVVFVLSLAWLLATGQEWGAMAVPIGVDMPLQWVGIVRNGGVNSVIPPGWFLQYLAAGYIAISLGAANSPQRCAVWLLCSIAWSQWLAFQLDFRSYYATLSLLSLAFATGASAYHLGLALPRDERWSAVAGALSYPIYLVHYQVGGFLSLATGLGMGWSLFWASLGPTIALSWLLWRWIDAPVNRFRKSWQF
jgi:peptidoglycan/LPS O-acetylase OafA/YrhL